MGKKLAIRGHSTRGKEVIELLEMMGGKNTYGYTGDMESLYFFINNDTIIYGNSFFNDNYTYFTLEEFMEKFPYKVGDKVHIYVQNDDIDGRLDTDAAEITSMRWNPDIRKIAYKMKNIKREFYKEEIKCKVDDSDKPTKAVGKKLAIKGHPTRGEEIIELLKMLGDCKNAYDYTGCLDCYYYITEFGRIESSYKLYEFDNYIVYTLEEFLKKYPFKVGDKVVYTKFGDNCDDYPLIIKSMKWTGITIEYAFDGYVTCLAKDLKMWNGEPDAVISGIYLNSCDYADEVELNLGDYEIEVRDGKNYAVKKKPKYPTTYAECCEVIGISRHDVEIDLPHLYQQKMFNLFKLHICRDAYWKIAGEEMELDNHWEPDWNDESQKYCIRTDRNKIVNCSSSFNNRILAFPTEEMRDAFYENFKDLIEKCKELL